MGGRPLTKDNLFLEKIGIPAAPGGEPQIKESIEIAFHTPNITVYAEDQGNGKIEKISFEDETVGHS